MFKGQFLYSIDAKGRVNIPSKLRKYINVEAGNTFVMTQGTTNCIDLFPYDRWQEFEKKLQSLNEFLPDHAMFIRRLLQMATEDKMDSQFRILIPQNLLNYAQIEKEVLILGALKKIELWNPRNYDNYLKQSPDTYEQIAAKVMAL